MRNLIVKMYGRPKSAGLIDWPPNRALFTNTKSLSEYLVDIFVLPQKPLKLFSSPPTAMSTEIWSENRIPVQIQPTNVFYLTEIVVTATSYMAYA